MKVIITLLMMLFVFLMLIGCTPEGKLRRLIKKYPQLVMVDTVKVIDTTVVQGVRKDSIISIQRLISSFDTTIIQKERLTVRMIYRNDSIYVSGECETDTLYRYRNKYIYRTTALKEKSNLMDWLMVIGAILIILFIIKQFRNK